MCTYQTTESEVFCLYWHYWWKFDQKYQFEIKQYGQVELDIFCCKIYITFFSVVLAAICQNHCFIPDDDVLESCLSYWGGKWLFFLCLWIIRSTNFAVRSALDWLSFSCLSNQNKAVRGNGPWCAWYRHVSTGMSKNHSYTSGTIQVHWTFSILFTCKLHFEYMFLSKHEWFL